MFAGFAETLAAFVQIQLGDAVVVGDEEIGMTGASEVGGDGGERPAAGVNAEFSADFFKFAVAQIVEEIFAAAVFGVLKTVGHHASVGEMPEVDIFVVVATDEEIEQAVAVIVEPERGVGIDPGGKAGLFGDARKTLASVIVKKFGTSPFDEQQVFVTVVVVIAPDSAGGNASAGLVDVGDAELGFQSGERIICNLRARR